MGSLFMFGMLFWVFYFFLIRPQMKQAKEHKQMVQSLAKGDEIVTTGGLLGRINKVGDNFLVLEIAKDIEALIGKKTISDRQLEALGNLGLTWVLDLGTFKERGN